MPRRADREARIEFARQFIITHPELGKRKVNQAVQNRFGYGLRHSYIAQLKTETLIGRPKKSTGRKSVERLVREQILPQDVVKKAKEEAVVQIGFDEAYHKLISAGFMPFEIRKMFGAPNAPAVFGTEPFRAMLRDRRSWLRGQRNRGVGKAGIIELIKQYYKKSEKRTVFDFLRDEYPTTTTRPNIRAYREVQQRRAHKTVKHLYGRG